MSESKTKKTSPFSLRLLVLLAIMLVVVLALIVPVINASIIDGLYFAPYHLLGSAFAPITIILFFASPVLLITIGALLYFRSQRPVLIILFLLALLLAVFQVFASRPYITVIFSFSQFMSPVLVFLSITSMCEVGLRKLKPHRVTAALTLPIAFAYWFMALAIISNV